MSFTEWRSEWTRLAAREPLCLSLHTSLFFCFLFFFSHSASSRSFLGDYFKIQVAHGGGEKKVTWERKKKQQACY